MYCESQSFKPRVRIEVSNRLFAITDFVGGYVIPRSVPTQQGLMNPGTIIVPLEAKKMCVRNVYIHSDSNQDDGTLGGLGLP